MSLGVVSIRSFDRPVKSEGHKVGQLGISNCFLEEFTSITQSSYSIRCSRHGVVSNTGGMDTGALIKPKNDIFIIN